MFSNHHTQNLNGVNYFRIIQTVLLCLAALAVTAAKICEETASEMTVVVRIMLLCQQTNCSSRHDRQRTHWPQKHLVRWWGQKWQAAAAAAAADCACESHGDAASYWSDSREDGRKILQREWYLRYKIVCVFWPQQKSCATPDMRKKQCKSKGMARISDWKSLKAKEPCLKRLQKDLS